MWPFWIPNGGTSISWGSADSAGWLQTCQELADESTLIETSGAYPPGTASFVRRFSCHLRG